MENEKRGQDLANIFRKLNFGYETLKKKTFLKIWFLGFVKYEETRGRELYNI
jgi:hypothetical protein